MPGFARMRPPSQHRRRRVPAVVRSVVAVVALLAVVAVAACSSTEPMSVSTSPLDGAWTTHASGVTVFVTLTWTRDSVTGTGTYTVLSNMLGCGGQGLSGSGTLVFRAARPQSQVSGVMIFDTGWSPPYTGELVDSARIDGAFRSIDAGACPFPLFHGIVP